MYTFEAGAKLVTPFIIGTGNGKPRLELLYSTQPVAALVGRAQPKEQKCIMITFLF